MSSSKESWIIGRFASKEAKEGDPSARMRAGQAASLIGIACNLVLAAAKGLVGFSIGSVSIVADAANNLSDASSNVVSLLGFKLASKPADLEHPYGHGRYEYLAALIVAALVSAVGIELLRESAAKIISPTPTEFAVELIWVLVISMLVKLWMMQFNRSMGFAISSETLEATAIDSRNDVITTGAVLASALLSQLTGFDFDAWMGLAVGVFILISGLKLVRDTIDPLLGSAPKPEEVSYIQKKILSYPGVLGTHDLMIHDYGPGRQFASAHVEMAAETNPLKSHDLLDNIEQDFKRDDHLIMTLHYDPIVTNDPKVHTLRNQISEMVKTIDPRITIHDLRIVPGPTHTNVIFDCVRPTDLPFSEDELRKQVSELVVKRFPKCVCVITIDSSYISSKQ